MAVTCAEEILKCQPPTIDTITITSRAHRRPVSGLDPWLARDMRLANSAIAPAQKRLFDELAENVDQRREPNAKNPLQGQRLRAETSER